MAIKGEKWAVGGIVVLIVFLIAAYVFNSFMSQTLLSGSVPLFILIVGIVLIVAVKLLGMSGNTTDLDSVIRYVLVGGALIYLLVKFAPQLLPTSFSVLARNALPVLIVGIPSNLWLGRRLGDV